MKKFFILLWFFALPLFATPQVVVSIKPLNDITLAVMKGVGSSTLLVPSNVSPHAYSLAPSQALALTQADLIVWVGPELETFLSSSLERRKPQSKLLTVLDMPGVTVYPARQDELLGHHHGQGSRDPHLWLDPENLKAYALDLAETLSVIDPTHAATYKANAQEVKKFLTALNHKVATQLAPVQDRPLMVFHDGYQYLEKRYHLDIRGVILEQPDSMPSVFKILEIQHTLKADHIQCIFREPQFKPAIVDRLVEHARVKEGVLDPIGQAEPEGLAGTQALFEGLVNSILSCVT